MTTARPLHTSAFATLLGQHRRSIGLSQLELARRTSYSHDYIGMLERGVRLPSSEAVRLLARSLELDDAERRVFFEAAEEAAHPSLEASLVGRARAVARLRGHVSGLGAPLLVLAGEPGIGKTRLLDEVRRLAPASLTVLSGRSHPNGVPEPFSPLLSMLEGSIHILSPEQRGRVLAGCGWLVRLLPELAEAGIDLPPVVREGETLPAEQEQRLVVQAIGRYLANIAGPDGVLLILDDLQWADPDGLALLVSLLRQNLPLRLLAAYRSTEVTAEHPLARMLDEIKGSQGAMELALAPLDRHESTDLLERLLGASAQLDALRLEHVLDRAEGVPFYLVSFADGLRSGADRSTLPAGITASVQQRVLALPPPARALLSIAAVAGRAVPYDVLVGATDISEEALLAALESNLAAGLLIEEADDAYRIRHDLIREVVEREIAAPRRTYLHRRIGEALETFIRGAGPSATDDLLGRLAYHYGRGGRLSKAIEYLERAGNAAGARYAHAAAEAYYRELLAHLEGREDRARVEMKLGGMLTTTGKYEEALARLGDAARLYRVAGDGNGELQAAISLVQTHFRRGTAGEGVAHLQSVLHAFERPGAPPHSPQLLAVAWMVLTRLLFAAQQYAASMVAGEQAVVLAEEAGDRRTRAEALQMRGAALLFLNRSAEAMALLPSVVPVLEETGALESLAYALQILASHTIEQGPVVAGLSWSRQALAVAEQLEDPGLIAIISSTLGLGHFYVGDWTEARVHLERGVELARSLHFSMHGPLSPTYLAVLEMAEGRLEEADLLLQEGEALGQSNSWAALLTYVRCRQAQLDLLRGRPANVVARLAPFADSPLEWVTATFLPGILARAYFELGDLISAAEMADRAIEQAQGTRTWAHTFDALWVRAAVLTAWGRKAEGDKAYGDAVELARHLPFPHARLRLFPAHVASDEHL